MPYHVMSRHVTSCPVMSRHVMSHHVTSYHFESRRTVTQPTLHCQLTSSTRNQFKLSMTVFVGCPEGCRYHTASAVYDLVFFLFSFFLFPWGDGPPPPQPPKWRLWSECKHTFSTWFVMRTEVLAYVALSFLTRKPGRQKNFIAVACLQPEIGKVSFKVTWHWRTMSIQCQGYSVGLCYKKVHRSISCLQPEIRIRFMLLASLLLSNRDVTSRHVKISEFFTIIGCQDIFSINCGNVGFKPSLDLKRNAKNQLGYTCTPGMLPRYIFRYAA